MASRPPIMARNETALRKKAGAIPTAAISPPAAAGPSTRAVLKLALFRPTALATRSGPTISLTNDCRAGMSKAVATPSSRARV
jgi:hypothetical protein